MKRMGTRYDVPVQGDVHDVWPVIEDALDAVACKHTGRMKVRVLEAALNSSLFSCFPHPTADAVLNSQFSIVMPQRMSAHFQTLGRQPPVAT